MRLTYFGLSSVWGFVVGLGGMLLALRADGKLSAGPGLGSLPYAAPGIVIALAGAGVLANAYQEAKKRARK